MRLQLRLLTTALALGGLALANHARAEMTYPDLDQMAQVKALAYQMEIDTDDAYAEAANSAGNGYVSGSEDEALNALYQLKEAASDFYASVEENYDYPRDTMDEFRALNDAFIRTRRAGGFNVLRAYGANQELFETIVDSIGNLRSYYFLPEQDYSVYHAYYDYNEYPYYPGYASGGVFFRHGYSTYVSFGINYYYRYPHRCHLHYDYYRFNNGYYSYRESYRIGFGRFSVSYTQVYARPWYGTYHHVHAPLPPDHCARYNVWVRQTYIPRWQAGDRYAYVTLRNRPDPRRDDDWRRRNYDWENARRQHEWRESRGDLSRRGRVGGYVPPVRTNPPIGGWNPRGGDNGRGGRGDNDHGGYDRRPSNPPYGGGSPGYGDRNPPRRGGDDRPGYDPGRRNPPSGGGFDPGRRNPPMGGPGYGNGPGNGNGNRGGGPGDRGRGNGAGGGHGRHP